MFMHTGNEKVRAHFGIVILLFIQQAGIQLQVLVCRKAGILFGNYVFGQLGCELDCANRMVYVKQLAMPLLVVQLKAGRCVITISNTECNMLHAMLQSCPDYYISWSQMQRLPSTLLHYQREDSPYAESYTNTKHMQCCMIPYLWRLCKKAAPKEEETPPCVSTRFKSYIDDNKN